MSRTAMEVLLWARGTGFTWALGTLVFGLLVRLFELFSLGRKANFAVPREPTPGSGWRTVLTRSLPPPGMARASPVVYLSSYVLHLGFFLVLVLFVPHIALFQSVMGLSWPGLPSPLIDALAIASLLAMLALLVHRVSNRVRRFLSGFGDYLAWALTFLPLATGYLAVHHLLVDYTLMLALHVLSAEALMALLPFTNLAHALTLFFARWYNGDAFARKGVAS